MFTLSDSDVIKATSLFRAAIEAADWDAAADVLEWYVADENRPPLGSYEIVDWLAHGCIDHMLTESLIDLGNEYDEYIEAGREYEEECND